MNTFQYLLKEELNKERERIAQQEINTEEHEKYMRRHYRIINAIQIVEISVLLVTLAFVLSSLFYPQWWR